MKTIMLFALTTLSLSAFSASESDFERGFKEGKASCQNVKEAWICNANSKSFCNGDAGSGATRAAALLNIRPHCLNKAISEGVEPTCIKL